MPIVRHTSLAQLPISRLQLANDRNIDIVTDGSVAERATGGLKLELLSSVRDRVDTSE